MMKDLDIATVVGVAGIVGIAIMAMYTAGASAHDIAGDAISALAGWIGSGVANKIANNNRQTPPAA